MAHILDVAKIKENHNSLVISNSLGYSTALVAKLSAYTTSIFKNKEGKFDASNKAVEKYSSTYSGYKYFGAKGLVVMAKNYYGLKDSFQATAILSSVIDNFVEYQEVVDEAKSELDQIKNEEAKTNSSIENTGK